MDAQPDMAGWDLQMTVSGRQLLQEMCFSLRPAIMTGKLVSGSRPVV